LLYKTRQILAPILFSLAFFLMALPLSLRPGARLPAARQSQPGQPFLPPPSELFFGDKSQAASQVGPYGTGTVRIDWRARRTDFDWQRVREEYQEFHDWYKTTKEDLEEQFASAEGRARIAAAEALFNFALDAEERKERLEAAEVYAGQWEGKADIDVVLGLLGTAHYSIKLSFATTPLAPGGLDPMLAVSGEGKEGSYKLKGEAFLAPDVKADIQETLTFSARVSGRYESENNRIFLKVRPRNIQGQVNSVMTSRLGALTSKGTLKGGTWKYRGSWPEMEAFLTYLYLVAGSPPPQDVFSHEESFPESQILEGEEVDGTLNWRPGELPDIKHEYFRQWFDTFWQILNEEISDASETKAKAELAGELYQRHVKKALAAGQRHKIRLEVIDHCRLWKGRAGSSLDESFETHFRWMDAWFEEEAAKAADLREKKDKAREKFFYSLRATNDFELGFLSQALRDKLRLWLAEEGSYIDSCFDKFFISHNAFWEGEVAAAATFEAKDAAADGYLGEVPFILEFGQKGVLSPEIIEALQIVAGQPGGYGDRVFLVGWSLGRQHFEGNLPPPPSISAVVEAFAAWMLKKMVFTQFGFVSEAMAAEAEARWEALLEAYPSARQKYGLGPA